MMRDVLRGLVRIKSLAFSMLMILLKVVLFVVQSARGVRRGAIKEGRKGFPDGAADKRNSHFNYYHQPHFFSQHHCLYIICVSIKHHQGK